MAEKVGPRRKLEHHETQPTVKALETGTYSSVKEVEMSSAIAVKKLHSKRARISEMSPEIEATFSSEIEPKIGPVREPKTGTQVESNTHPEIKSRISLDVALKVGPGMESKFSPVIMTKMSPEIQSKIKSLFGTHVEVLPTGKLLGTGRYGSVEEVEIPGAKIAAKKLCSQLINFDQVCI